MARVLMFGAMQDVAGWRERTIDAASLDALKALLTAEDADLGERLSGPGVFAVVNQTMVRGQHPLAPDDEVAFVPPVSGG
ncbi:MAG: MoaD/ThiS family protein [Alphaproteobacteria bacterium]|nr:MoaD/ThiS family protein [Alphaproteobacteria bacterium]MBU2378158.1 MoaD/ThiS family protein [Alphaproteobacteria bacterium]